MDRIGPRVFFANQEDTTGLRIYNEFSPQMQITWAGDSSFIVGTNSIEERLRPQDFAGLTSTRDYSQRRYFVNFADSLQKFGFSGGFDTGTVINLVPPLGVEPELADRTFIEAELLWRPMDRLRVDTSFLSTELEDREGRGTIFTDRIVRTLELPVHERDVAACDRPARGHEADGLVAAHTRRKSQLDVLFRYVLNPWSALYVGYNNNESNLQLIDTNGDGTMEPVRTDDLAQDGQQVFVKFSYLLQP